MLYPIVCNSCQRPIGQFAQIYQKLKREKDEEISKKYKINKDIIYTKHDLDVSYGDILDKLNITMICCRMNMISSINFNDILL